MVDQIPVKALFTGSDTTALGQFEDGDQIPANHLVLPKGYIDGLNLVWNSGTSISVTSGSAYIESLGAIVNVPITLTLSGLSLTAATWYHVYLYLNAGTPSIECVTAVPASPYSGTARSKIGDTSRRYLGSIRSSTSALVLKFEHILQGDVFYLENTDSSPFILVGSGAATSQTTVSAASIAPVTAKSISIFVLNYGTSPAFVRLSNSNGPSTSSGYLCVASPGGVTAANLAVDSSQAYTYQYDASPSGNSSFHRLNGYTFGR